MSLPSASMRFPNRDAVLPKLRCADGTSRWASIGTQTPAATIFAPIDKAKFLVLQWETGARGIRTLVAGCPTNRISRKRTQPDSPRLEASPEYTAAHRTDSNRLAPTPNWHRRWHRRGLRMDAAPPHRF